VRHQGGRRNWLDYLRRLLSLYALWRQRTRLILESIPLSVILQKLKMSNNDRDRLWQFDRIVRRKHRAAKSGEITNAVPVEHRADDLSNPAMSYDDCMSCIAARCESKFGVECFLKLWSRACR